MGSAIPARLAVTCTLIAFLGCGVGPGRGPATASAGGEEIPEGGERMSQAEQDRRVDYIEFQATDIEGTKRFYSGVFGWKFTDFGPDYSSFSDGRLAGGFSLSKIVPRGGPLVVIYSQNLEWIKGEISRSGGRIVREIFEFPGGRRFHFTDPSGNELAVWSDR